MVDYSKRLVEVDVILNHLNKENYDKIPEDIIKTIEENKDKDYIWEYDETKTLKEQGLNRDTIIFLSYINMEYLLTPEQKELMEEIHNNNEKLAEDLRQTKYGADDLFKKNDNDKSQNVETNADVENNTQIEKIAVYQENILIRIFNKIRNFLKK